MNCKNSLKLLPLFIGDDLEEDQLAEVKEHINGCLSCYREYQEHLKARRFLKRLAQKPDLTGVMDHFTDEVAQRISGDSGGPAAPVPRVMYTFAPRILAAAALILLLITGSFYLFGPGPAGDSNVALEDRLDLRPRSPQPELVNDSIFENGRPELLKNGKQNKEKTELLPIEPQRFPVVQPAGYKRNF